jgi:cell division protein FtsI (penicillin-binding protein 3)
VASALDEHAVTLDQRFPCGERMYGGETLHDADGGPCAPLDVAGIVARSSNVGVTYVFALGSTRLRARLGALHIGDPPGSLPVLDDDRGLQAANLAGGELATATPMQVARAYAALFNGGVYVAPAMAGGEATKTRVFSEETARAIVPMLENAVTVGTGKGAAIEGVRVAGKTGTAEWTLAEKRTYFASFVGAVLDREPRFVALVGLEVPAGKANGPKAAAPAWKRIASRILAGR